MNDLIRRQDAINVIDDMFMEDERYKVWLKLDINNLPSAPMDAIPIEWIEQYLYDLVVGNEKHVINVGEILSMSDEEYYLKHLIKKWKQEQEKVNDQTD